MISTNQVSLVPGRPRNCVPPLSTKDCRVFSLNARHQLHPLLGAWDGFNDKKYRSKRAREQFLIFDFYGRPNVLYAYDHISYDE